ncbi:MAG: gamma-glutamyltransferase [Candidatus Glassbacteria bacterium]|nr:gamma-glutamyltransferase [Candidatus Glassbacteria bacterium]
MTAIIIIIPGPVQASRAFPFYSHEGMVVSAEPHASAAGFEVLRAGGNAADAAAAVGFVLAATFPSAGNLGGGGFLVYRRPDGRVFTLNYREKAPAAASRDMFLGADGKADPELSRRSLLAVGVPGSPAGMLETWERFGSGKLSREQILARALSLAEKGFAPDFGLVEGLAHEREWLSSHPSTSAVFYPGGKTLEPGDTLRQPDLARTLREIAGRGRDGFYSGWVADSLAAFMAAGGGLITRGDLAAYRVQALEPVAVDYRGYRVYGMGPPSSGGMVLGQVLKLLEPFDLAAMGHNSAAYVHHLVEAERLAYADRNHYLGDPDYVEIPLASLLSGPYLDSRRRLIPEGRAGKSLETSHGRPGPDHTTHFCVIDRWGGLAAVTTTLNGGFGMGAVVPGAGFFLNNEMDDFAAAPGEPNMFGLVQGEANSVAGGKRMLSCMTPTVVTRVGGDGSEEPAFVIGAAGGSRIITTVLQVFLNLAHFGMNVREAVEAPRFHHQHLPDVVCLEPNALSADTRRLLEGMGYALERIDHLGTASAACVLTGLESGTWYAGWADGMGVGAGTGY